MHQIIHYLDEAENDLYQEWLDSLRDRVAKVAESPRVSRRPFCLSQAAIACSFRLR